jgi:hypothetical protein
MSILALVAILGLLAFVLVLVALIIKGTVHVSLTIWKFLELNLSASPRQIDKPPEKALPKPTIEDIERAEIGRI